MQKMCGTNVWNEQQFGCYVKIYLVLFLLFFFFFKDLSYINTIALTDIPRYSRQLLWHTSDIPR